MWLQVGKSGPISRSWRETDSIWRQVCYPPDWKVMERMFEIQLLHSGKCLMFLLYRIHPSLFGKQGPGFLWGNNISPLKEVLVGQSTQLYYSHLTRSWAHDPRWPSHVLFPGHSLCLELSNMRVEKMAGTDSSLSSALTNEDTKILDTFGILNISFSLHFPTISF